MRPYTNAQPFHTHGVHWPTDAEYTALQEAERQVRRLGQNHNINIRVRDGSGNEAHVFWGVRDANDWLSGIWIGKPGSRRQIKDWFGVPKWDTQCQGGNPMKRYPDHHIYGDQIDFRRPANRQIDARQHIDVHHGTIFNHIHHEPVHEVHGVPGQGTVYLHGTQITMHQPPAEQRQQIADRGHVVEVRHQHAALPKPGFRMPGARQLALPAPTRTQSSNSRPLGLPAPQQQPMQPVSARARVLAVLNGAKR